MKTKLFVWMTLYFSFLITAGCSATPAEHAAITAAVTETQVFPTLTAAASPTITITPTDAATPTATPTTSPTPSPTPQLEPPGCQRPGDDYTLTKINGWLMNQRTVEMLQHAAELYGGEIDITGYAVTQGSYTDQVAASFGTHAGGGAVDLSVMRQGTYTVLYDEIEPLIQALRTAGFAAWLRDLDELYPGSPFHIHAIAIGDQHLSIAARDQLTGPYGYFRGYSGVPQPNQIPIADRHGGPLLCLWMIDMGYSDLRLGQP
jgi:hypothetical protein